MQASFLRAPPSLPRLSPTGVAAAAGMGVVMILIGIALRDLDQRTAADAQVRAAAVG
jgi:hypothetical protein